MSTYSFITHKNITSKTTGKQYEIVELSNGKNSFTLFVKKGAKISDQYTEGDEVTPELELYPTKDGKVGVSLVGLS